MAQKERKREWPGRLVLGILVCCASMPPACAGQDAELTQLLASGEQLQEQGRYEEAESTFQSALDRARASSEPLATAQIMYQLAMVKQIRGDFSGSEALYQKAIDLHPSPRLTAAILLNNARLDGH